MSLPMNPFTRMLVTSEPEDFYGRQRELASILQGISATEPNSFTIFGIGTIGKTTLLKYLRHKEGAVVRHADYISEDYRPDGCRRLVFVYINFHDIQSGNDLFQRLFEALAEVEPDSAEHFASDAIASDEQSRRLAYIDALRKLLTRLNDNRKRVIFLLDDFDTVVTNFVEDDERELRRLRDLCALVIATEEPISELITRKVSDSPLLGILIPRRIGLLDVPSAKQLINDTVTGTNIVFSATEQDLLLRAAGRQPFLLTAACEALFELHTNDDVRIDLLDDLQYRERFQGQLILRLSTVPVIADALERFWNKVSHTNDEVAVLYKLAEESNQKDVKAAEENNQKDFDTAAVWPAIQRLINRALIYQDIGKEEYLLFSEVFADFIRRKQRSALNRAQPLLPETIALDQFAERLTAQDRKLFLYLREHVGQICTFDELQKEIWGSSNAKRGLEAAIHRIRKGLEQVDSDWDYIKNIRGEGYEFTLRERDDR